ncbi:MAG: hypothetical protein ACI8ZO_000568, partial [Flavobacteriales bacterium]
YLEEGISCYGLEDASIRISANGGVGDLQYKLGTGPFQQETIFEGLGSGKYYITTIDQNGCSVQDSIEIAEPNTFGINITDICNSSATAPNGAIDLEVNNIIPPVSYLWEHGPTTQDVSNLSHLEDYMVTITDGNGCERDSTFTIQNCIGLEEETTDNSRMKLYPNPISKGGLLRINYVVKYGSSESIKIRVLDMLGQTIRTETVPNTNKELIHTISINQLSKGTYFIQIMDDETRIVKPFVVQ